MSCIVGSVALSALSLSITLAWYASSDRLNVSAFEVKINGSHNLLISTVNEPGTFKESLSKEELNSVDLFVPASSMHKDTWMNDKGDTPIFYDNSFYNVPASGIPQLKRVERGFYQQKIYLLSDITYNVTLDVEQSKFSFDETANKKRAEQLHKENDELSIDEYKAYLDNLVKCVRLSILVPDEESYAYYIVDPYKEENQVTYYGGRLDNDNDGYYDTYEYLHEGQVIEKETVYGEVLDRSKLEYDEPSGEPVEELEEVSHFYGNSFNGVSKGSAYTYNEARTKENLEEGETIYAVEESMSFADISSPDNKLLIPCTAGVAKEIVVSIYLEGWDHDCVNATMGASFVDDICFKLAKGGID